MKKKFIKKRQVTFTLASIMIFVMLQPSVAFATTQSTNDYPIILVNGFAGWGRDELLGYKYWGGLVDLEQVMTNSGHATYTAAVSPFASNWDRACELYAYIQGGIVDYGEAHSEKYGHERYGRTYPGIYLEWGETTDNEMNKVHLVGHSMGGQTARLLVQLLECGSEEEKSTNSGELSPLFEGGKSWVLSVTTIATPNDGTTLADQTELIDVSKSMLISAAAVAGLGNELVYDFKLEQWGIEKELGESYSSYGERVWNSSIWTDTKDFSAWDLSTQGAKELNSWVVAQADVYYFSFATCATHKSLFTCKQVPNITINPLFIPFATLMGNYTSNNPDQIIIDEGWLPNDGVVNTISQDGPKLGSNDEIISYSGIPQLGKWNYMGLLDNTDHLNSIGQLRVVNVFYLDLAEQLSSLPTN